MSETPDGAWTALDRRTVAMTAVLHTGVAAGAGGPVVLGLAAYRPIGSALAWVLSVVVLLVGSGVLHDAVRCRRTRYRIGPVMVELRAGVLVRSVRSVALEQVRSVDITAGPLLRAFGLVVVRIGTGQRCGVGETTLELRSVTRAEGDRLHEVLLDRIRSAGGWPPGAADGRLAGCDPRWVRYAPLSCRTPLLGGAAAGAVWGGVEWFGMPGSLLDRARALLAGLPVAGTVAMLVTAALVVGAAGSLLAFTEKWWNFRLDREPGATLRVRRGLLAARSISLEERTLRGVELVEPWGLRWAGAARVDAVGAGLVTRSDEIDVHHTLLPAAPRALADRVAAVVLGEAVPPTVSVRLAPHPPAARARRLRRGLAAALLPVLGCLASGLVLVAAVLAAVAVPVALAVALDMYRNLGHGISGRYLVTRSGSARRSTVVLRRDGVIGWTVTQSVFQRRAGLITITATTAAGAGAFSAPDVGESAGLRFAEESVPELFGPFLERDRVPALPGRNGEPARAG